MACNNCNQGNTTGLDPDTSAPLPTIATQQSLENECAPGGEWIETPDCGPTATSETSAGSVLPSNMTDARCLGPKEGGTILLRFGNLLAKFVGDGFIQIKAGKAYVVKHIPVGIQQLWHRYYRTDACSTPILGDPHPYDYAVIGDEFGNLYGIKGIDGTECVQVWGPESKKWEIKATHELPISVSKALAQSDGIEMVGFDPVPITGDPATPRTLKALRGNGIVYMEKVPAPSDPDACQDSEAFSYVAKVLETPGVPQEGTEETGRHHLVFSNFGLRWEPLDDATSQSVLGN